jgi:Uma2 family endonuclease
VAVHVDASVPLHRISVESFFRMGEAGILGEDDRVELLRGAIVEMSPPSTPHDDVIEWLNMRLVPSAIEAGLSVRVQSALVLEPQDSVPMPDLVVVDPRRRGSPHPTGAHLAIEVSVSSRRIDLGLKATLFAEAGVPEYWVVDVPGRRVVAHADPVDGEYRSVSELRPGDEIRSLRLPPVSVADLLDGDLG